MRVGGCDRFLAGCGRVWVCFFFGWVWVRMTFFGWGGVGVGECDLFWLGVGGRG